MKEKIIKSLQLFTPLILGGLIGFIINSSMDYTSLNQPPLSPPSIIFPIVWSILYLLMGISYFLYRKEYKKNYLYYLQLVVNLIWPILFFTLKLRFFSIIWIIILAYLIYRLIIEWKDKKRISAYLLIPYLIWTIFATYLNIGVFLLN